MLRRLGNVAIGDLVQFWIIMGPKYHLQYHFHREGSPENKTTSQILNLF